MAEQTDIYPLYLEQLQGLQSFRQAYHGVYQTQALERDDPELKRLTEAIAYCTAHAQYQGERAMAARQRNLMAQIHPYMITPLPAKTILQVKPTEKLKAAFMLESGSVFQLQAESGEPAQFQTCRPLKVLPLRYTELETRPSGLRGLELRLNFTAMSLQTEAPGEIPVYLSVCNDFRHTLLLYQTLQKADVVTSAYFDQGDVAMPCEFKCHESEFIPGMHPVETCRQQLHFPYAQFFVTLDIAKAPEQWRTLTISFSLKQRDLLPTWQTEYFQPFCVPMINLYNAAAKRIQADGTQVNYPVSPPSLESSWALHSIQGVYQQRGKQRTPLLPSVIQAALEQATQSHTFSLSYDEQQVTLDLNLPQAFKSPCSIDVDACWHQPDFSQHFWQKVQVTPFTIDMPGVNWQLAEPRQIHQLAANQEKNQSSALNGLLAVRANEVIEPKHLNALLTYLSAEWSSEFDVIAEGFMGVERKDGTGGIERKDECNHFALQLRIPNTALPVANLFLHYFQHMVNAWFAPQSVQLSLKQVV